MKRISYCFCIVTSLLLLNSSALWATDLPQVRALLVPSHEATLSSQIDGRILSLPHEAGDSFAKGDLLAELDCEVLKAELQKARTDLEAAEETHTAKLRLKEYGSASELEVQRIEGFM